jgi:hypothetical protein
MVKLKTVEAILRAISAIVTAFLYIIKFIGYIDKVMTPETA